MSVLRIAHAACQAMRLHGERTYPNECCGALLGRSVAGCWEVVAAVEARNASTGSARNRYSIAPADLVRIEREARRQQLAIAGYYHSHPGHPAEWSPTDLAEAHWLGCVYVITSVLRGRAEDTRAFLLAGEREESKRFERLGIEIFDKAPSPAKRRD